MPAQFTAAVAQPETQTQAETLYVTMIPGRCQPRVAPDILFCAAESKLESAREGFVRAVTDATSRGPG